MKDLNVLLKPEALRRRLTDRIGNKEKDFFQWPLVTFVGIGKIS